MIRRSIACAATLLVAAASVLAAPSYADDSAVVPSAPPAELAPVDAAAVPSPPQTPVQALTTARRVLSGEATPRDPSPTVALRDLWLRRTSLRGDARREATAMLARPTDGTSDPQGFGYTVPSTATCNARLCVHHVATTKDAPPSPGWVDHTLGVMDSVWSSEVDGLGFRAPLSDGLRGGSAHFDVYLKDLGGQFYGYCATESRVRNRTASGFCVLDNDFSASQFPQNAPETNLAVTAAHEFFHAIQYAYDFAEDPWMMESTATWMEERVATDVNDNRQYLPYSQLYTPFIPLDMFSMGSFYQYGNWIFWEHLTNRFGTSFVNKAWNQAGSLRGDGGKYSLQALRKLLRRKGGLTRVYADFAADNLVPSRAYREGLAYSQPKVKRSLTLSKRKRSITFRTRLFHLTSGSYRMAPGRGLAGRRWHLALRVSGPPRRTSPAAVVTIHRVNGNVQHKRVRLNRAGDGRRAVTFNRKKVAAVSITLVNASTRFRCSRRTYLACGGKPLDDKLPIKVTARVVG